MKIRKTKGSYSHIKFSGKKIYGEIYDDGSGFYCGKRGNDLYREDARIDHWIEDIKSEIALYKDTLKELEEAHKAFKNNDKSQNHRR